MTLVDPVSRTFDQLPPHSIEAEMCVLASMMLDARTIPSVKSKLGTAAFFQADHQAIAGVLFDMHAEGKAIDAVLLRAELRRRQLLDEVGGHKYIGAILNVLPSAAHARHYVGIVAEQAAWREVITICNEGLRAAYEPHSGKLGEPAMATLTEIAAAAMKATEIGGAGDEVYSLRDVALEVADGLGRPDNARLISTGLRELDGAIGGLLKGGKMIVGARSGVGKSALVKQIAVNVAEIGVAVGIITVEETRHKIAANRLAAAAGVENNRIAFNRTSTSERERIRAAAATLPANVHIMDAPRKLSEIVAAAHLLAGRFGCQVIAVDHLHIVDGDRDDRESREREISRISATLKGLWKTLDVAGIEVSQLNRNNGDERPTPASLRDSGSLEADGDVILLLHREDYYRKKAWKPGEPEPAFDQVLEILVAKNKDGAEGFVPVHFDEATQLIVDLAVEDPF